MVLGGKLARSFSSPPPVGRRFSGSYSEGFLYLREQGKGAQKSEIFRNRDARTTRIHTECIWMGSVSDQTGSANSRASGEARYSYAKLQLSQKTTLVLLPISLLFRRPDYMPVKTYLEIKDTNRRSFQKDFLWHIYKTRISILKQIKNDKKIATQSSAHPLGQPKVKGNTAIINSMSLKAFPHLQNRRL